MIYDSERERERKVHERKRRVFKAGNVDVDESAMMRCVLQSRSTVRCHPIMNNDTRGSKKEPKYGGFSTVRERKLIASEI